MPSVTQLFTTWTGSSRDAARLLQMYSASRKKILSGRLPTIFHRKNWPIVIIRWTWDLLGARSVQSFEGTLRVLRIGINHDILCFHKAPYEDIEGRLAGMVGVIIDVTEKKRVEAQQILSQKLESIGRLWRRGSRRDQYPMQYLGDNTRFLRDGFTESAS